MLPQRRRCSSPFVAMLACAAAAAAADAQPRVVIPRVASPPSIDALLSSGAAGTDAPIDGFVQREPGDGVPASQTTRAYLSYDAERLYVLFVCGVEADQPARAHLSAREAIAADDQVGILLDTFHDGRRAYRFTVNALGIQSDALVTEGQPDDFSYDTVWDSTGTITPSGFIALLSIPFRSLRLSPDAVQDWGIALVRVIPRNSEESYWPAITHRVEGLVPQFATATGVTGVTGGRNVQLTPFTTIAPSASRASPAAAGLTTRVDSRVGFDGKFVLHDALTIDVTANPDFSQIESDEPQVTTNQRFEVFFPERRPFFIENAGYFLYGAIPAVRNVPETLFFSRRIADPGVGARATGKLGRWALGAIAINDRAARTSGDPAGARMAVARVQREFGAQAAVGLFASTRSVAARTNTVAAFDTRVKLGANWVVSGFGGIAVTRDARLGPLTGYAANANVSRTSRRFLYNLFYSDRSPRFQADLGFVPRTDIRQIEQYAEYRWHPVRGPIVAIGPNSYVKLNWARNGALQEWILRYPFEIDLKGRTAVFVRRVESADTFKGTLFRQHLQTVNVSTEWLPWLAVSESLEGGTAVNFFPAAGNLPALASFVTASATLSFRPSPQFRFDLRYLFSGLETLATIDSRQRRSIFDSHVARTTVRYQFTRTLSLRTIVDYRATLPNPSLVALGRNKQITADVLTTYLLHPGTAVYVGYTSSFDNLTALDTGLVPAGAPTRPSARQLFVKASYVKRF